MKTKQIKIILHYEMQIMIFSSKHSGRNSGFLCTIVALPWYRLQIPNFTPWKSVFVFFGVKYTTKVTSVLIYILSHIVKRRREHLFYKKSNLFSAFRKFNLKYNKASKVNSSLFSLVRLFIKFCSFHFFNEPHS